MKTVFAIILSCFCITAVNADVERIFIDAKINGKSVRFAFDTGSSLSMLYSTSARRLGLKVTPPDPNQKLGFGDVAFGATEPCNVDFGITNFTTSLRVMEVPSYLNCPEDGIFGWPDFSNNVFSLDCEALKINTFTSVPEKISGWVECRVETNSDLTLGLPSEKPEEEIMGLDTGSPDGVELSPQKWHEWKITHTNQPATLNAYYTPSIGNVIKEETWANRITIGSLVLTDVPVQEADSNAVASYSLPKTQYEATLGLTALKRLDIIIDGKHGVVHLWPKKSPPLPYEHNRLGAVFVPHDLQSDDLIAHVIVGSPAHEAGIRDGDVLLKENGQDVTNWRTDTNAPPDVRPSEQPAGTKLELTLKRSDKIFTTTALLRNILPPDAPANSN